MRVLYFLYILHEKSQHFTARNRDNTSSSESLSYEY
jgi:hypothetical protein